VEIKFKAYEQGGKAVMVVEGRLFLNLVAVPELAFKYN
jgi:hypothetical protein